MAYNLKRTVFSWRFLVLLVLQVLMYYYMNHWNLTNLAPHRNFYDTFLNSISCDILLLGLFCAGLVGLLTYDELDKNYQPLLFSRSSIRGWIKNRFLANALAGGIFILLPWLVILLFCFYRSFPPELDLFNFQFNPYISIVSANPTIATIQMIGLDLIRVFLFGMMLSAVATLGAVVFRVRFLALAFPAILMIIFDYYTGSISPGMIWSYHFFVFNLAGRYMTPWFSFAYLVMLTLFFFTLANYFVLRRLRYE